MSARIRFFISAVCLLVAVQTHVFAQTVYYTEDFDAVPCPSGCPASGYGGWTVTDVTPNGIAPNEWFVSCAENGMAPGQCGSGCAGNNSLHVGSTPAQVAVFPLLAFICPTGDCGAAYFAGIGDGSVVTDKRAESPAIDLSAACDVQLKFNYIENGDALADNLTVEYFDGLTWAAIPIGGDPAKTTTCPSGQGLWAAWTLTLPASANGNPNVKIGFRWKNNDDGAGTDPSAAIDSIQLVGGGAPSAAFTFSSNPFCMGPDISAYVNVVDPSATYTWDIDGLQFTGPNFPTGIQPLAPGNMIISLTAENLCGIETIIDTLLVADCSLPPVAVITASDTSLCIGDCISFSSVGSGPVITQYSWSFPGATTSFAATANPTNICYDNPFPGTYDVQLTIYGPTGLWTDTTLVAYINVVDCSLQPQVDFSWTPDSACIGDPVDYTSNCPDCTSYVWSFPGGSPLNSNNQMETVTYAVAGTYSATLIGSNALGVSDTITYATTVVVQSCSAAPVVSFTWDNDSICAGGTVTFTSDCPTCIQYDWTFAGGTPGASFASNPTVTFNTPGIYDIELTGTDANGLSTTVTQTALVEVVACGTAPIAAFTPSSDTVCAGSFLTFANNSTAAPGALYGWYFTGGSPLTSLTQNPGQITFSTAGSYDVLLVVNDIYGTDSVIQTIVVENCPLPVAYFTASAVDICKNQSVTFTDSSTNAIAWSWNFAGGSPATDNTSAPPPIFYSASGVYSATLTVTDANGLDSTYSITINVSGCGIPEAGFTVSDQTVCAGACVRFYDASIDNPSGWSWQFPGGTPSFSSQQNPPYVCYDSAGTYPVTLIAFNSFGPDTALVQGYITVYPPFVPSATPDSADIIQGQSVTLSTGGGVSYQWYPVDGLTNDSLPTTVASPLVTTTYSVLVTNANDCTGTAQVVVNVRPPDFVFVPNLFTPNGDRVNDVVKLQFTGAVERAEFAVFDRWGNTVFYSTDENIGWDGRFRGAEMNTGVYVYFYRVRFTSGFVAKGKGDITLLR